MQYARISRRHQFVMALVLLAAVSTGVRVLAEGSSDQPGRCFMWKVSSGTNVVYLLGSIHAVPEDFYPLPQEIEDAFTQAKFLCVEVDDTKIDQAAMQALMQEKGMFKGADSLSKVLSKTTQELLNAYCAKNGIPPANLEKLKPWVVGNMIDGLEGQKFGVKGDLGIDKHFLDAANLWEKKEILELETADSQFNMLSGLSSDTQEKFLATVLSDLPEMKASIDAEFGAWKKGDAKALEEELILKPLRKHPEIKEAFTEFCKKAIYDRNIKMAEKIDGYLKKTEPYFVVVGAAHLVGEQGLVKLLANKKYKVEQVRKAGVRSGTASVEKPAKELDSVPEKPVAPANAR